ncbi:hypothetical protein GCM10028895_09520 [Pontibacter rugosus]
MTQKIILLIASALGGLTVAIGAFGAHALAPMLQASGRTDTFETAVKYQMYHTLALLAVGLLLFKVEQPALQVAAWCFFWAYLFSLAPSIPYALQESRGWALSHL